MSRKDFTALAAKLLARRPPGKEGDALDVWKGCVRAVADACSEANSRFNYNYFYTACGLED